MGSNNGFLESLNIYILNMHAMAIILRGCESSHTLYENAIFSANNARVFLSMQPDPNYGPLGNRTMQPFI